ncbi:MAG: hypothetical protein KQI62_09035 [Deltaproteobacteria bacterium]|nr:hypothetical protein [Deltaproteobacteria bacterium]
MSQSRIEALTNQLAESAQEAARQGRRALDLGKENDRLRAENQALRTRGTAAALSPAEAKLIAEVSGALGVPKDQGLLGALERVRANLASVGALSPPTVHESGSVQKSEGDGDGPEQSDVPPRANSSS